MPGKLNEPIEMNCACGEPLPTDQKHRDEHPNECCECYDIGWGMKPPIILGKATKTNIDDYD